jgi:charged multivesicular body protein 4
MDALAEEKDIQDAISEAISRPGQEMFNDEDLLDELAELDALEMEESLAGKAAATPALDLPTVPSKTLSPVPSYPTPAATSKAAETDDERALRELEASMLA